MGLGMDEAINGPPAIIQIAKKTQSMIRQGWFCYALLEKNNIRIFYFIKEGLLL